MIILPIILKPKWGGGRSEFYMMYMTNILIRPLKGFSTIVMCINFHTVYQSKMCKKKKSLMLI